MSQYVNGTVVGGTAPEVSCVPSDLRAPVRWTTSPILVNLERDYGAQFVPSDLNHTLRFPTTYEQLPEGSVAVVCDLINVDEPDSPVDPMQATVFFVQSEYHRKKEVVSLTCVCAQLHYMLSWYSKDM